MKMTRKDWMRLGASTLLMMISVLLGLCIAMVTVPLLAHNPNTAALSSPAR